MNKHTAFIIERSMRIAREATDFGPTELAICNLLLHDALDQLDQRYADVADANDADVDSLTARLDAANVQLGTLRSQLAQLQADIAGDATLLQRYEAGYHAGVNDDPEPTGNPDTWYMLGYRAGCWFTKAISLQQVRDELRNRIADLEAALEAAQTHAATVVYSATVTHGANGDAPAGVTLTPSPAPLTIPAGDDPAAAGHRQRRPETGFRFKGSNEELLARTITAIQTIAQELGRAPITEEYNARCNGMGLPTFDTLRTRLHMTWLQLVLAADLAPAPSDGRRSYRDVRADALPRPMDEEAA